MNPLNEDDSYCCHWHLKFQLKKKKTLPTPTEFSSEKCVLLYNRERNRNRQKDKHIVKKKKWLYSSLWKSKNAVYFVKILIKTTFFSNFFPFFSNCLSRQRYNNMRLYIDWNQNHSWFNSKKIWTKINFGQQFYWIGHNWQLFTHFECLNPLERLVKKQYKDKSDQGQDITNYHSNWKANI